MTGRALDATYRWVDGSLEAAGNPPHDARWRPMVTVDVTWVPGAVELGLELELKPHRVPMTWTRWAAARWTAYATRA